MSMYRDNDTHNKNLLFQSLKPNVISITYPGGNSYTIQSVKGQSNTLEFYKNGELVAVEGISILFSMLKNSDEEDGN